MILFEHEDKKYKVLFRYGVDNRGRRTTTAFVCYQGKNQPVLFEATATCSLEDNFCKETGRKVALNRLINRIYRWAAYRQEGRKYEGELGTIDYSIYKLLCKEINTAYYNREKK